MRTQVTLGERPARDRRRRWAAGLTAGTAALVVVAAIAAIVVLAWPWEDSRAPRRATTPKLAFDPAALTVTDPQQLRAVTPERAEAINAAMPVSALPNPAARAFVVPGKDATSIVRSLECMTAAIYYEAATEPIEGRRAVAQVILNRMRNPAFPHTVCGVVYQGAERSTGCQFSFTCDGSLARRPVPALWQQARSVAAAALGGFVYGSVGWATYYHADYVSPYWSGSLVKLAVIGRHIFYRLPGAAGAPTAFSAGYAGSEPDVTALAKVAALPGVDVDVSNTTAPALTPLADRPVLSRSGARIDEEGNVSAPGPAASVVKAGQRWVLPGSPVVTPPTPANTAAAPPAAH